MKRQPIVKRWFGMGLLLTIMCGSVGCSSLGKKWKALISGDNAEDKAAATRPKGVTFSQQNQLAPNTYRKYKRMNRKDFEDSAHLESKSGSLWVMEGQGAYLFSQNVVRMIGDPLTVRIEGDPADQLNSKVQIISKLLNQLEDRRRRALGRGPAGTEKDGEKAADKPTAEAGGATNPATSGSAASTTLPAPNAAPGSPNSENLFNVKSVPTRVVERTVDGNYRVRGTQPFMIGSREYKVIVTGVVRAEDFNENGVSAAQLIDANYDIASSKSTEYK